MVKIYNICIMKQEIDIFDYLIDFVSQKINYIIYFIYY